MKLHEAVELIEQGKKVRLPWWGEKRYVHANEKNCIVDQEGQAAMIYGALCDDWELVEEPVEVEKMEAPQIFKDLYKVVNEILLLRFEEDIILQFIKDNDYEYPLVDLKHLLEALNNIYNLDDEKQLKKREAKNSIDDLLDYL